MAGCIDRGPQLSQVPSFGAEDQPAGELASHLQVDFEAELKSNLFSAAGKVLLLGNGSLPYLMLNATLSRDGGDPPMSTKYLLMQLEPNRDYSFEISKNMRIQPGDYNCTLQVSGPQGILAREIRKCCLTKAQQNSEPSQILLSIEAEFAKQKALEEMERVDSVQASKIRGEETPQDVTAKKKTSSQKRELAEDSLTAEVVEEENDSSLPGSMPASSFSDATKATFIGSSTSKKYHLPDCRYAAKIKPENKINFQSREDAKRQGYLPCKSCNP